MIRIAVLDDYQNVARRFADWNTLSPGASVTVFNDHVADQARLVDRLRDFEVVCAMRERTPFPRAVLEALPNLRMLVTTGARNASFDMAAATELGIVVTYTGGTNHPTPELTWALILALFRQIPVEHRNVVEGRWQTTIGRSLHGATLGLVGLGRLGEQVAHVGKAFGMQLIAWSQNLTEQRAAECGARRVDKEELFRTADVATVHLVLSGRSRGLIGAPELALMKPTAYLVNTSRGPIVDEKALLTALRERRIAGAGLDVYDVEPLPTDHPFRSLDNVVLTPHIGYVTDDTYRIFYGNMVENIRTWMAGGSVRVLNPEAKPRG